MLDSLLSLQGLFQATRLPIPDSVDYTSSVPNLQSAVSLFGRYALTGCSQVAGLASYLKQQLTTPSGARVITAATVGVCTGALTGGTSTALAVGLISTMNAATSEALTKVEAQANDSENPNARTAKVVLRSAQGALLVGGLVSTNAISMLSQGYFINAGKVLILDVVSSIPTLFALSGLHYMINSSDCSEYQKAIFKGGSDGSVIVLKGLVKEGIERFAQESFVINPETQRLTFKGFDHQKGIILFAQAQELGDEGRMKLWSHTVNLTDNCQVIGDNRMVFCQNPGQNSENLDAYLTDPSNPIFNSTLLHQVFLAERGTLQSTIVGIMPSHLHSFFPNQTVINSTELANYTTSETIISNDPPYIIAQECIKFTLNTPSNLLYVNHIESLVIHSEDFLPQLPVVNIETVTGEVVSSTLYIDESESFGIFFSYRATPFAILSGENIQSIEVCGINNLNVREQVFGFYQGIVHEIPDGKRFIYTNKSAVLLANTTNFTINSGQLTWKGVELILSSTVSSSEYITLETNASTPKEYLPMIGIISGLIGLGIGCFTIVLPAGIYITIKVRQRNEQSNLIDLNELENNMEIELLEIVSASPEVVSVGQVTDSAC